MLDHSDAGDGEFRRPGLYFPGYMNENLAAAQAGAGMSRDEVVELARNAFGVSWLAESPSAPPTSPGSKPTPPADPPAARAPRLRCPDPVSPGEEADPSRGTTDGICLCWSRESIKPASGESVLAACRREEKKIGRSLSVTPRPDFEADTTEGRSTSTTGSATPGRCCSRTRRTSRRSARPSSGTWRRSSPSSTSAASRSSASRSTGDDHERGQTTSRRPRAHGPNYPIIGDADFNVSKLYGMLRAELSGDPPEPHAGRQPDGAQRVRHRPGQEGQADPRLPDDDRPQLRRGAAGDRLPAADGQAPGRHAGQLEAGEDVIIAGSVSNDEAKEIFGTWEAAEALHPDRPPAQLMSRPGRACTARSPRSGSGLRAPGADLAHARRGELDERVRVELELESTAPGAHEDRRMVERRGNPASSAGPAAGRAVRRRRARSRSSAPPSSARPSPPASRRGA